MDSNNLSIRIGTIVLQIMDHVRKNDLPPPDFCGGPSLEAMIRSLLVREKLTDQECFEFTICSEHVDPTLEEEDALQRMGAIIKAARIRRGCPPDRMNDAVSM